MSDTNIPKEIDNRELLYRGIHQMHWIEEESRPTTAAFKDKQGASVDRDCMVRNEMECVDTLRNNLKFIPLKAVCSVSAESVRLVNAFPIYKPSRKNRFHSEIHDSIHKVEIDSDLKLFQLISRCKIIMLQPSVEKAVYQIEQSDSGSTEVIIIKK